MFKNLSGGTEEYYGIPINIYGFFTQARKSETGGNEAALICDFWYTDVELVIKLAYSI
jgi:hypothetical protein